MDKPNPFHIFKISLEIILLALMLYVRLPLLLRNVEGMLYEREIDASHVSMQFWQEKYGPLFVAETQRLRSLQNSSLSKHLLTTNQHY